MKPRAEEIQRIEIAMDDLRRLLERAKAVLTEADYQILEKLVGSFTYMTRLLENQGTTIQQLRRLLFGQKSEKLSKVLEALEGEESPAAAGAPADGEGGRPEEVEDPGKKRKGHGRNPADAYQGAERITVKHESLKPGDPCPEPGCEGKVYELAQPGILVRIVGRAPLGATVIELQKLRCNLCLMVFTAREPEGLGTKKYDETAASLIALLRYGTGVPFNRLEGLQANFRIPLPSSTQWDVVEAAYKKIAPAYDELIEEAAQGDVLYNDDTPMKILELIEENKSRKENQKKKEKLDDG